MELPDEIYRFSILNITANLLGERTLSGKLDSVSKLCVHIFAFRGTV